MPEGPSIVILKEQVEALQLVGQKVSAVSGNSKIDQQRLLNAEVKAIKSWGKHFLICFEGFAVRVHLMLFGTYTINERKDKTASLTLTFTNGEINFYTSAIKLIEGDLDQVYDWQADIMSADWNEAVAYKKLMEKPDMVVCDALLDQQIFSGSGNIIKNEVLYRIRVHPLSLTGELPIVKLKELIQETRNYSFDFLKWKKEYTLKQHWLAHTKKICLRCQIPFVKAYLGKTNRRSYYCTNCQKLYN